MAGKDPGSFKKAFGIENEESEYKPATKRKKEIDEEREREKSQADADRESAQPREPLKKNNILKLSNPAEQQKSLPYQAPEAGDSDLNDSDDHNERSQDPDAQTEDNPGAHQPMPAHRRREVLIPKRATLPKKNPGDLW